MQKLIIVIVNLVAGISQFRVFGLSLLRLLEGNLLDVEVDFGAVSKLIVDKGEQLRGIGVSFSGNGVVHERPLGAISFNKVFLKNEELVFAQLLQGNAEEDELVLLVWLEVVQEELLLELDLDDDAELLEKEAVLELDDLNVEENYSRKLLLQDSDLVLDHH